MVSEASIKKRGHQGPVLFIGAPGEIDSVATLPHLFEAHYVRPNRLRRFVEQSPCGRPSSISPGEKNGDPNGSPCFLARPERFELPTARFVDR